MSDWKKYECIVCGWVYDEALGCPEEGIEPGTTTEPDTTAEPGTTGTTAPDPTTGGSDTSTGAPANEPQIVHEFDVAMFQLPEGLDVRDGTAYVGLVTGVTNPNNDSKLIFRPAHGTPTIYAAVIDKDRLGRAGSESAATDWRGGSTEQPLGSQRSRSTTAGTPAKSAAACSRVYIGSRHGRGTDHHDSGLR